MSKFFTISPIGKQSPDLFQTMIPTFTEQGHSFVSSVEEADIVLIDLHTRVGEYDQSIISHALYEKKQIVSFDEWDHGGMSKDPYPYYTIQQKTFFDTARQINTPVIQFVRKMDKTKKYLPNTFPYEKTIQNTFPITTKEELCSRPYDFCFIGNTSPQRKSVVQGLLDGGLMGIVRWTNESGKISHEDWFNIHRSAKLFLSADGGGYSDERSYQLITVAGFLRQKNTHLQRFPFSDCINCLEVSEHPTSEEIEGIKSVLSDPDYLYEIYTEGVAFMKEHYSAEARANYILSVIKKEGII